MGWFLLFLQENLVLIMTLILVLGVIAFTEFVIPKVGNSLPVRIGVYAAIIALAVVFMPIVTNYRAEILNRPAISVSVYKLDSKTAQSQYDVPASSEAYLVKIQNPQNSYEVIKQVNASVYFKGQISGEKQISQEGINSVNESDPVVAQVDTFNNNSIGYQSHDISVNGIIPGGTFEELVVTTPLPDGFYYYKTGEYDLMWVWNFDGKDHLEISTHSIS